MTRLSSASNKYVRLLRRSRKEKEELWWSCIVNINRYKKQRMENRSELHICSTNVISIQHPLSCATICSLCCYNNGEYYLFCVANDNWTRSKNPTRERERMERAMKIKRHRIRLQWTVCVPWGSKKFRTNSNSNE